MKAKRCDKPRRFTARFLCVLVLFLSAAFGLCGEGARAIAEESEPVTWDSGTATPYWHDAANWSTNQVPGGTDDVLLDVEGDITVRVRGDQPAVRSIVNHETIWIEGTTGQNYARLTSTEEIVNNGVIRLETTTNDSWDRSSYLVVTSGALVNAAGGRIEVNAGAGDARSITGNVTNEGTIDIAAGTTLYIYGTEQVFVQAAGLVTATGGFVLSGGTFTFTGGTLAGTVRTYNSRIQVEETVTSASTLRVVGPSASLLYNASETVTIWVEGTQTWGNARLTAVDGATNHGTIHLETTSNDSWDRSSHFAVADGGVFTNEPSGKITTATGAGDSRHINGHVVNRGLISAGPTTMFTGTLVTDGGTYGGSLKVYTSTLSVSSSPTEPTTLHLVGASNQLVSDNLAGLTLWVEGTTQWGLARLTAPDGFVNHGIVRLETTSHDHIDRGSYLVVSSGTLTNAADGRRMVNLVHLIGGSHFPAMPPRAAFLRCISGRNG